MHSNMITVVIASYKYGHLAAHCIESLLSQTLAPKRIIFVDDGAHDCSHLPGLYPDIEYILRPHNLGTVDNFHDLLMMVDTEYVLFLGADNWLRSDAIELLSDFSADIVTYDIVVTGELKEEIHDRVPGETNPYQGDLYWDREGKHHGSMMYRTSLGQKVGYKQRYADGIIHKRIGILGQNARAGRSVDSLNEGLLFYRRHRENFLKYDHLADTLGK